MSGNYIPEPGHLVRVQRWEVPCPELPGGPQRQLLIEMDGTVASVRKLEGGVLFRLEGMEDPIFTGYQFAGQDPEHGCSWTLQTEVIRRPDPAGDNRALIRGLLAQHQPAFSAVLETIVTEHSPERCTRS
jgi:hypothetical protein